MKKKKVKKTSWLVKVPAGTKRKMIGSRKFKRERDE